MNEFLLSVIIPTKNRQEYLLKCVDEILSIGDGRIQIVIQDNSSTSELSKMLPTCERKNAIKYQYTSGTVSFVDNFSLAVEAADGIYSCIIGDDDGITDYIGDVTEWAYQNDIEAIKPDIVFEYFWPDSIDVKGIKHQGLVRLLESKIAVSFFRPYDHLKKLLYNGGQDYTSLDVGKLYHGIVKTKCLNNIKKNTGKYFGGLSPDIYMAVALSLTVDNAVKISLPLTIAGVGKNSGSADSSSGRHVGFLEAAPHLKGHREYKWSKEVPRFYSVETIWADSMLAALYDFNRKDLIEKFSIANLDAYCKKKYPEYSEIIKHHYKEYQNKCSYRKKIINTLQFNTFSIVHFFQKVHRRLLRLNKKLIYMDNLSDIIAANHYFNQRCNEKGVTRESLLSILNHEMERKNGNVH